MRVIALALLVACDSPRAPAPSSSSSVVAVEAAAPVVEKAPVIARGPQQREHQVEGPNGKDILFEPRAPDTKPIVVFLHALCGASWHFTYTLEDLVSSHAFLLSPEGNRQCRPGTSWTGGGKVLGELVDSAISRAGAGIEPPPSLDAPRALIGFSQGAYVALEIARANPGRYKQVVLIGMILKTSGADLRAAGVEKVVLSAGDRDGSAPSMRLLAKQLEREEFPARYVSLGPVGHTIPLDANTRLREAVEWLFE